MNDGFKINDKVIIKKIKKSTDEKINKNSLENKDENIKVLVDNIFLENKDIKDDQTIMAINVIKK